MAIQIEHDEYFDKVYGGWFGKFIGGTIGGPVEGTKDLLSLDYYQEMPDMSAPNDDADFQLVWLHALEEYGPWLTGKDLAHEWLDHIWYPFCEYGYGMKNFSRAIYPPTSGWFNNEYYRESMGCPIRSEIWAFVCPGAPALAREYAWYDATLDHADASVEAERFLATMEAMAFFESDISALLEAGMNTLPDDSRLGDCLEDTCRWYTETGDWKDVRGQILAKYGSPDMTSAVQNLGFTVLALLEGGNDFETVMLTAANCGYDTDCTCATAGALLGIIIGAEAIPGRWKDPLQDQFSVGIDYERPTNKISDLTEDTCAMGALIADLRETGVEIVDAPRMAEPKTTEALPPVRLRVEYPQGPAIAPGGTTPVQPVVVNATHRDIDAVVRVKTPDYLSVEAPELPVHAPGMEFGIGDCDISCPTAPDALPLTNICEAELVVEGEILETEEFGLAGPWMWRVFGPFWDGKDAFTNEVDLDKQYLPEDEITPELSTSGDDIPHHQQLIFSTAEDRFSGADIFDCDGPMVMYLLQYIECPEERDHWILIGSTGGYKLWVNGETQMENREPRAYMPFSDRKIVTLQEGRNTFVWKVVRFGDDLDISFGVCNVERNSWHASTWTTDISVIPPVQGM